MITIVSHKYYVAPYGTYVFICRDIDRQIKRTIANEVYRRDTHA